jgi:putative ABC transport system permease protein
MLKNYLAMAWKVSLRRKLYTLISLLCIILTLVVLLVATALLQHAFMPSGVEGRSERYLQVLMVEARTQGKGGMYRGPVGYKLIEQYLKPLRSARVVSAVTLTETVSVYQDDRVSELQMRHTDAEYWRILDFKVLAGRVFSADDVKQGRMVAVINASTARRLFPEGAAVGRKITAGSQQFEVAGVVEDALHFNAYADIWVPVTTYPTSGYREQMLGSFTALLMADEPAGVPAIQREVESVARTVQFDNEHQHFDIVRFWADTKLDLVARQLLQKMDTPDSGGATLLGILALLALLFMLLPALNLVNLNMGRIMERSGEIGVRKAFGATSGQLVAQLLLENTLLCLAGGALSLLCAWGVLAWLEHSGLVAYLKVDLNLAVFGYGLLLTVVFGVLSGALPAWRMSRLDPVHALKGAV